MREDIRRLLLELAVVVVIIALVAIASWAAMAYVNRKLGVEPSGRTEDLDLHAGGDSVLDADSIEVQVFPQDSLPSQEELLAEQTWESTPCSIYVDSAAAPVMDTLPEATSRSQIPLELQLVVEAWATHAGLEGEELDRVYAFSRHDSVFVDLPQRMDVAGLARTLEGRFVCFTRLFPIVGGVQWDRYPSGLRMRGVADGVR
ncbi:MAG: hypothetical protein R6U36_04460 [Candidatus Fermentibacteraceae bacterium]